MHERVRKKFFGNILAFLRSCNVAEGGHLLPGDTTQLVRLIELEHTHLHKWVSEAAVLWEVFGRTHQLLRSAGSDYSDEKPLEDVLGTEALERHVTDIVAFLASIPYRSTFWAHLRGVKLAINEPIEVGELRLFRVGLEHASPRNPLVRALSAVDNKVSTIGADDVVLEIPVLGYSRGRIEDSSPVQALSLLKQFLVFGEALGVFTRAATGGTWTKSTPLLCEVLHASPEILWIQNVPLATSQQVDRYELSPGMRERLSGLLSVSQNAELPDTEVASRVQAHLLPLGRILQNDTNGYLTSLKTAAQWYFDALAENNETTAFLFVSLGLEALLGGGDTEGVGLKKLLANRLAYLLGADRLERELLIKEFSTFYDRRSALVHGRELRLSRENKSWLSKGRDWLRCAIAKELLPFARN